MKLEGHPLFVFTMACPSNFIVSLKLPPPMQGGGTWTMPGRIWRRLGYGEEERKKGGDGKVWLRVVTPNRNSWRKNTDIIFKLYIYTTKIHLNHAEKSILESQKVNGRRCFPSKSVITSQHPSFVPRLTNQFWRVKISPLHPFVDTLSTQEKVPLTSRGFTLKDMPSSFCLNWLSALCGPFFFLSNKRIVSSKHWTYT